MTDKRFKFSEKTDQILKEDAKKARLSENEYVVRLIEKRPVTQVPDNVWQVLSELHEDLNANPVDRKKIAETIALIEKKYIYGNDKTLGSKE